MWFKQLWSFTNSVHSILYAMGYIRRLLLQALKGIWNFRELGRGNYFKSLKLMQYLNTIISHNLAWQRLSLAKYHMKFKRLRIGKSRRAPEHKKIKNRKIRKKLSISTYFIICLNLLYLFTWNITLYFWHVFQFVNNNAVFFCWA